MSEANHLDFIIAMLRNKGDTDTAEAPESGQYDLNTVKKGINSIYGVAASSCDKRRDRTCSKAHGSN